MRTKVNHKANIDKIILFIIIIMFCQAQLFAKNGENPGASLNPNFMLESYPGGIEQFLIGDCLWEFKSNAHNANCKLIDIAVGGRYGAGYLPETIGRFVVLSGNYWLQNTKDEMNIPTNSQYKCGVNVMSADMSGIFKQDIDFITFKAEVYKNPIAAGNSYSSANKYVIPGFWSGLFLEPGYFNVIKDSNMITGKDTAETEGFGYRLGFSAGVNFNNNYTFKLESTFRQIYASAKFYEFRINAKFTKEYYYTYVDKKWKDTTTKALELFAFAKYNYSEFDKGIYRVPSIGVGISFYNYIEYLNVWEILKRMN